VTTCDGKQWQKQVAGKGPPRREGPAASFEVVSAFLDIGCRSN